MIRKKHLKSATANKNMKGQILIETPQTEQRRIQNKRQSPHEGLDCQEESMEIDLASFHQTIRAPIDESMEMPSEEIGHSWGQPPTTITTQMDNRGILSKENQKEETTRMVHTKAVQWNVVNEHSVEKEVGLLGVESLIHWYFSDMFPNSPM